MKGGGSPKGCGKTRDHKLGVPPGVLLTGLQPPGVQVKRGQLSKEAASQIQKERSVEQRLIVAVRDEWVHGELHLKLTRHRLHFIGLGRAERNGSLETFPDQPLQAKQTDMGSPRQEAQRYLDAKSQGQESGSIHGGWVRANTGEVLGEGEATQPRESAWLKLELNLLFCSEITCKKENLSTNSFEHLPLTISILRLRNR